MKASQANEMKPVVDGLAAGERWQYLPHGQGWRDIEPGDHILLEDAKRYRKKPRSRRLYVGQRNGKLGLGHWFEDEYDLAVRSLGRDETLVEFVEVLK